MAKEAIVKDNSTLNEALGKSCIALGTNQTDEGKAQALAALKGFSKSHANPSVAKMSDAQIKDLIASRYE